MKRFLPAIFLSFLFLTSPAHAEEYPCEVMLVHGQVFRVTADGQKNPLKEGELLKAGDSLEVAADSYIDIAYDKQWNNVTRVWHDSHVKIESVYPTGLKMENGDLLARLNKLPLHSTFEVETPNAIAAVRGSVFRTVHRDGVTEVFNLHSSKVEVFVKNVENVMERTASVLRENEKAMVRELGEAPPAPEKMTEQERKTNAEITRNIEEVVRGAGEEGKISRLQSIESVTERYGAELAERVERLKEEFREGRVPEMLRPNIPQTAPRTFEPGAVPVREPVGEAEVDRPNPADRAMQRVQDAVQDKVEKAEVVREAIERNAGGTERLSERVERAVEHTARRVEAVEKQTEKVDELAERAFRSIEKTAQGTADIGERDEVRRDKR